MKARRGTLEDCMQSSDEAFISEELMHRLVDRKVALVRARQKEEREAGEISKQREEKEAAERARQREEIGAGQAPGITDKDTQTPDFLKLRENYKEVQGINSTLEEAIMSKASVVEKRLAKIAKLQSVCTQEKQQVMKCYNQNPGDSLKCDAEVSKFVNCVCVKGGEVIRGKLKSMEYDMERIKREQEIASKYKI